MKMHALLIFTVKWYGDFFYAFPPFVLISKMLQKIKRERATGIVVVPWWPSQPWFPLFESMVVSKKKEKKLEPRHDLLLSPSRDPHPLHRSLILIAAILSELLS